MARDGGKVGLTFYWGTLKRTAVQEVRNLGILH